MGRREDPFEPLVEKLASDEFAVFQQKTMAPHAESAFSAGVTTARLHGFDLDERPLIGSLLQLPGEILTAQSTVPLWRAMVGSEVVVALESGDPFRPIILGVLQQQPNLLPEQAEGVRQVAIQADGERYVVTAEREIVLRCGDASITLTRAGKVIIKGNYILSRSTGCNKIKGAAIDIN
ncbi:MAG: hypothetical protein AW08_03671 [Candidatus Accumulibacter adjunctus]|uniref:DUF6484 domain-containing protein n=1 Tax=Candidatus Accumulibacter adjunctus TaxID=1454001 RepID=A0A011NIW7_9PROT|nr:MAG: hypothetical protein AW08_03671 [Candidatus Accumulibacter adjunctus]